MMQMIMPRLGLEAVATFIERGPGRGSMLGRKKPPEIRGGQPNLGTRAGGRRGVWGKKRSGTTNAGAESKEQGAQGPGEKI